MARLLLFQVLMLNGIPFEMVFNSLSDIAAVKVGM